VSREVGLGYRDGDANEVNYDIFEGSRRVEFEAGGWELRKIASR